jgi:hypothetical protein
VEIETHAPVTGLARSAVVRRPPVATETLALLTLALMGILTLGWIAVFAWVNARAAGLI